MPADHEPVAMYRAVGLRADGVRELCAAAVSKEIAETIAALERKIRDYKEVVVELDDGATNCGKRSRKWN